MWLRFLLLLWMASWTLALRVSAQEPAVHGNLVCSKTGTPVQSAVLGGEFLPRHESYWYGSFPALMENARGRFTWRPLQRAFRVPSERGLSLGRLLVAAEGYRVWQSEEIQFEEERAFDLGTIRLIPLENELFRLAGKVSAHATGVRVPSAKLHLELPHSPESRAFVQRCSQERHFFERKRIPFLSCGDPREWSPPWPLEAYRTHADSSGKFELFVDESLDWRLVCVARGFRPKSFRRDELVKHLGPNGLEDLEIALEKDEPIAGTVRIDPSDREVTDPLSLTWIHGELRETFPLLPTEDRSRLEFTAAGTEIGKGQFSIAATSRWAERLEPYSMDKGAEEIVIDLRKRQTFKTVTGQVSLPPALMNEHVHADLWRLDTSTLEEGLHPRARIARSRISSSGDFALPAPSAGTYVVHIQGQDRNGGVIVDKRVLVPLLTNLQADATIAIDASSPSCRVRMNAGGTDDPTSVWIKRKSSRGWIESRGFWTHASRATLVYGLEPGTHEFEDLRGAVLGCFEAVDAPHYEVELTL